MVVLLYFYKVFSQFKNPLIVTGALQQYSNFILGQQVETIDYEGHALQTGVLRTTLTQQTALKSLYPNSYSYYYIHVWEMLQC